MIKKIFALISTVTIMASLLPALPVRAQGNPAVLLTEIQTREFDPVNGLEAPDKEFVELYNQSEQDVDITGWKIEYMPASYDGSKPGTILTTISGILRAHSYALFAHSNLTSIGSDGVLGSVPGTTAGYLAKTGGHIRLLGTDGLPLDCLAWGSSTANIPGVCNKIGPIAGDGGSLQRVPDDNGVYDRWAELYNNTPATPRSGGLTPLPNNPTVPEDNDPEQPNVSSKDCSVVELSEVLPNPAGTDTEKEYIELYNPSTETVPLLGCSLRLGQAGKTFTFGAQDSMQPNQYRAFYYTTTGLSLTNSGGEVWLLTPSTQTSLTYGTSADDQVWANIDGIWQTSFKPTPGAPNELLLPGSSSDLGGVIAASLEACPVGKYRSPETNRCRNIELSADTSCPEGQERNSETNRCRKIVTTTASVVACGPGQERNPETNRCRKIAVPASATPCPEGQERNSETNRCRKVAGASTNKSGSKPTADAKSSMNYKILVGVLVLVTLYAIYEYRQDIKGLFRRRRQKGVVVEHQE